MKYGQSAGASRYRNSATHLCRGSPLSPPLGTFHLTPPVLAYAALWPATTAPLPLPLPRAPAERTAHRWTLGWHCARCCLLALTCARALV
jgi:hypothetical protein